MDSNAWTAAEESAFQQLMRIGGLDRLPAIRLYRRSNGDLARAEQIARESRRLGYPAARASKATQIAPSVSTANFQMTL